MSTATSPHHLPYGGAHWVDHVARHAHADPDGVALRFEGATTTWAAFDERIRRLARGLHERGVAPGDRVVVLMTNRPEFLEAVLAANAAGAIAVPVNFRLAPDEAGYILSDSGATVIVTDGLLAPLAAAASAASERGAAARPRIIVAGPDPSGGGAGAESYDAVLDAAGDERVAVEIGERDVALIMYTSGTTGLPKGAMLTHLNLLMQSITGIRTSKVQGDDAVVLLNVPLFHIAGIGSMLPALLIGATSVIMPTAPFDALSTLDVVESEGITSLFLVPAQWQVLCADPAATERGRSLRTISWGAAPATVSMLETMSRVFPYAEIVSVFGQTEMSPVTTSLPAEDAVRKIGSVGRPIPTIAARIVDDEMNDVEPGQVGEIVYRGPSLMAGYWNNPQATADAFEGGWFHSGDLVRADDEGFLYVVDRKKDMIISGGENIYCAEVENAIAGCPAVADVAVIGAKHERWGETPVAIVVPADPAAPPTIEDITAWTKDRLASYKKPTEIVVVAELPRNASGKVRKHELRELRQRPANLRSVYEEQIITDAVPEPSDDGIAAHEIGVEQAHVSRLYLLLDELLVRAQQALDSTARAGTVGTPGARAERDAFMRLYGQRVRTLQNVEQRLCFGRLDLADGQRRYVGRIGMSDEARHELLVDWRAPAAEPFYQATAARPGGVLRRRQIATEARRVTSVQDEVLDLEGFEASGVDGSHVVVGEGALFASLDAARSPRMRDIVATIQADQDEVIRAPLAGVLVVQGGPGTGKTAVALHRTAFLLYANRERIARSGVLLVGPNRVFLRYIDQVLPALGEADAVVMSTPGELYPGVVATATEAAEVVALKGDLRMADVIAEAVRRRQRLLQHGRPLDVEGTMIQLQPRYVREAREQARRSRQPHNQARQTFVSIVLRHLVRALAEVRGVDVDDDTRPGLMTELYASVDVRRELNLCWPPISAERLVRDLYANPQRLAEAAGRLRRDERDLLRRERSAPWSAADVPLLDEAAELLGDDDSATRVAAAQDAADRTAEIEYAKQVQETFGGADFATAEDLAGRYLGEGSLGSVAERANADRSWSFGHVVVDEAQELSPMAWRLLMRRCPSKSFTVVGDVAQTSSAAGARAWGDVLTPHVDQRWRQAELTVNYRTPEQVMDLAASVLAAAGSTVRAPASARVGRHDPQFSRTVGAAAVSGELADIVQDEWKAAGEGTVAVITSAADHKDVAATVRAALPDGLVSVNSDALGSAVSVLTVGAAKGLEFDTVVLVEPSRIVAESPRGLNDLYVALTRPTQRLHVVHHDGLPAGMAPTDR